jgi:hypothetical protein
MKIKLLKPYRLVSKELPEGKEIDVTNEKGNELIEKGIAEDVIAKANNKLSKKIRKKSEKKEIKEVILQNNNEVEKPHTKE